MSYVSIKKKSPSISFLALDQFLIKKIYNLFDVLEVINLTICCY